MNTQKSKEIKEFAKNELISKTIIQGIIENKPITFTMTGIKEAINQPHKHLNEKNNAIFEIVSLIKNGKYIKFEKDNKERASGFHYIETNICNSESYIVLKENFNGSVVFYTIVDRLKKSDYSEK